jgi:hypothetical protein
MIEPKMTLAEVFDSPDYKRIADQIENHMMTIKSLMAELNDRFPLSDNRHAWVIMGNNRPHVVGTE